MDEKVDIRKKKFNNSIYKINKWKNINLISINEIVKKDELNRETF